MWTHYTQRPFVSVTVIETRRRSVDYDKRLTAKCPGDRILLGIIELLF